MPHSQVLYISKTFTRWSTHSLFVHTLGWLSLFKKEYAHVALYKMDSVCYCLKNQIAMNEKWIFDMTVVLKNEAQNKILATNSLKCHDFEISWEDTQRRKALCLQDVRWDILKCLAGIHIGEKPFTSMMWCATRHSETSWEGTHERKALCLQDVSRDIL